MNSTKSLILLALLGYTAVSGAVIKKTLAQADCPILSGQAVVGSSTLTSSSAAAEADTTTGSQVISDLSCTNEANVAESDSETGTNAGVGCEAAKKLYLFGGAFDYYDTIATTETGAGSSLATASGVQTATASSSL
jgi:hypothetical protein